MTSPDTEHHWDERTSAPRPLLAQTGGVCEGLFERSADAIWLYDPETALLVDCNEPAVKLLGVEHKRQLLPARPEELSPPVQADGSRSTDKSVEVVAAVRKENTHRFEWLLGHIFTNLLSNAVKYSELGLLLVKRCTELHGGNVQRNSRIGAGTTVTVRLPVFRKEP